LFSRKDDIMARGSSKKGFNNAFGRLKAELKAAKPVVQRPVKAPKTMPMRGPAQSLSDEALFAQAVAGASFLDGTPQRIAPKPATVNAPPTDDALAIAELEDLVRGNGTFRVHESEEYLYGLAPGVNHVLLEALKRGQCAYQHCIDLHGMTREIAHVEVSKFISQARCRYGDSCVLVVTGRGLSSPNGQSVLREALPRWLTRAPIRAHVLAFCTARAVDGGPGAFYVLLRRQGQRPFGEVLV
jgi:DNA-nicking Smr family endonuclease